MEILIVDDEPLAREELRYLLEQNSNVTNIYEAESIDTATKQLINQQIDLVFLDIQLGDDNGFTLAKRLKDLSLQPRIVFATAYDEYALDAFDANALDYILKPFEQERVDEAVNKGMNLQKAQTITKDVNPRMSVTIDDKTQVINKSDILYAYVEAGVLIIKTNGAEYRSRQTLTSFQEKMDQTKFLQIHRGYVVNLDKVVQTEPSFNHTYELTMKNGDKIPVGRAFVSLMKGALGM